MPPSVAGSTLTHVFRQATTKRHFEQLEMQFPAGCCTNITWRMGASTLLLVVRAGALSGAASITQISEITRELFHRAGARDHRPGAIGGRPSIVGQRKRFKNEAAARSRRVRRATPVSAMIRHRFSAPDSPRRFAEAPKGFLLRANARGWRRERTCPQTLSA
jgi:hypothetical protein